MSSQLLANKVALVTGAGRGIGRAIAIAYAGAGASVCCAARTRAELEETVRLCLANGGQAMMMVADVSDLSSVEQMIAAAVDHFGGLDILVVNAGIDGGRATVEEGKVDDWQRTLDVNLSGAYYCAKTAIPYLKARGSGKIIMVGSGMGHKGKAGAAAYSVSKAGMWMLTRILGQELWQDNISVNELIPGPVNTDMTTGSTDSDASVFNIDSEWKKGPEDVAPLALFLASQPDVGPSAQSFSLMRRDN